MKLENYINKELLSFLLKRKIYGIDQDNLYPEKQICTTCYMLYSLDGSECKFTKLELADMIKKWIIETSDRFSIPFINIYSGFDSEENEDYSFCVIGKGWGDKEFWFYEKDESLAIFEAGKYYLDTYYEDYLKNDKENWL